ncbi:virulence protein (plasmid) [Enterobacter bugandensis]|uniref:SpvB/TcaC N-terminal domain-containing protein n=1 Tax=Enterobacter bugandensis TaxID=881260 RepID=UPI00283A9B6E|nr:SpvB/TcaC N-terminal domain-containing protein [Enterobacter bugandensis]WMU75285.1 virulence protein [Enterobacter bugandensis]
MQHSDTPAQSPSGLKLEAPSLPKGGGALTGLSGQTGAVGPDGAATLSVPLPVSAGRGYAPSLSLNYSSQAGNGPFGMGWSVNMPAIRRRTRMGAPFWTADDEFLGPDGEALLPAPGDDGKPLTEIRSALLETPLNTRYDVSTWRSRTERDFSRLEYWQPADDPAKPGFWVLYSPDGQAHLLGYEAQARISDPHNALHTAQWLLNASVSVTGEQIWYHWLAEDEVGCSAEEIRAHPDTTAQRYLSEVHYGNITAGRHFPCLNSGNAGEAGWLFVLVFDYGKRSTAPETAPVFAATTKWPCRQDPFSDYKYGFEIRTRRLCRQVLMFHRLATLNGEARGKDTPVLISRLLLEYSESPFMSVLSAIRQMAFEDTRPLSLPPLSLEWQTFSEPFPAQWQLVDMGNMSPQQPWQYVDLWGEGVAGVLYQDNGAWWYRSPVRDAGNPDSNAIILDEACPLPAIPLLRGNATLTDLNGDGRLQWVVSAAGVNGHYDQDMNNPGQWLHFTPISALPQEYAHPRAQLADLTGSGFADLVLIGPRSVRLYAGREGRWEKGQTVIQSGNVTLPLPGADPAALVAFSDPLGSGQQHLVQIRHDGVMCWPNLGQGRFGHPLMLPGFSQPVQTFNPDRVFLADIDGSGSADVIYAHNDQLDIYRNQSGNGFAAPFSVSLPEGVRYDSTCQLQVADVQGLGVASLLLGASYPTVRHYLLNLSVTKPWLLNKIRNHMGAHQTLHYRSSAQFWLDEKMQAQSTGQKQPACWLPFPVHTLWQTISEDEITGNRLVSVSSYRHGVWDGREREFRGFGYMEVRDTSVVDVGTRDITPPAVVRSWYATGNNAVDSLFPAEYWSGDADAFPLPAPRYTTGSGDTETACLPETEQTYRYWLHRASKGVLLRSETFGADGSEKQDCPYTVTENRPQVRLITTAGRYPVVWPTVSETRNWHYERIATDPQCSQQVVLKSDEYGLPLRQVTIHYPRRNQPENNPYPGTLPETLFASSYDAQQQRLHLTLTQNRWHYMTDSRRGIWVAGLPDAWRSDVLTGSASQVPAGGLNTENLCTLTKGLPGTFAGQQQTFWLDNNNQPSLTAPAFPPRQAFTETAELDDEMVAKISQQYSTKDFSSGLENAGYRPMKPLFAESDSAGTSLWAIRSGATVYGSAAQFWRPQAYHTSSLTGASTLTWDPHFCVVTQHQDAAGLNVSVACDWRFLSPVQLTDVNANVHRITLDALGRVTSMRFSGTENGLPAGYSNSVFTPPDEADSAIAVTPPLPVAQCYVYVPDSWANEGAEKIPPHVVILTTDRYDNDAEQQIRQQVIFSDGFGRELQTSTRFEAGEAWQRSSGGGLVLGENGLPVAAVTDFRWAVSGRTEYDNKGQPVRTYQPCFLNDWRYVSDDSARQDLYADMHYYDPTGRVVQVLTAKGYLRRTLFTPWFTVFADENDSSQGLNHE